MHDCKQLILGLLVVGLASASPLPAAPAPELRFVAPPELAPLVERLERFERDELAATATFLGLEEAGPPIPVHLVLEGSGAARRAPSWGLAYATGGGQIVLIPSRVPAYPNRRLETVLHHEVAHVLINRAAGGHQVPRWFHEGLALYSAREWGLEDRSRLLWATLRGHESALKLIDRRFSGGASPAASAYAFSAAFVRFLIDEHGHGAPGRILAERATGAPFYRAFKNATGSSLTATEASFFRHLDFWNKWVPVLTSSTTLWLLISLLAVYAWKRRRARDAEILERWDQEEAAWTATAPPVELVPNRPKPKEWIH